MDRMRWTVFCLAILLAGLAAGLSPAVVSAAPSDAARSYQSGADGTDVNERNFLSVPGVFSLRLGSGGSTQSGALRLNSPQVDLPALNATATVEGLTVNGRDGS